MWKRRNVVNLGTSSQQNLKIYNVFALVPLGSTVSLQLTVRGKSARREDVSLR